MTSIDGSFIQQQEAFGQYLTRWYNGLYADTRGIQAFKARGVREAIQWVPSRMIDAAENMLAQYRQNLNGPKGASSLLPVVLVASDDDFVSTGADWGGQHTGRELVQIEEGGSWYGHRQIMHDRRFQVVIAASERDTANFLAAQLASFIKTPSNRYLEALYRFGQYQVPAAIQLETNRIDWMAVKIADTQNLKMLAGDVAIKCVVPVFDAPAAGEPNDGTLNDPPGYPVVTTVSAKQHISVAGVNWNIGDERLSQ